MVGIGHSPLCGLLDGTIGVGLPEVGDILIEGVVEVGGREEGLDREEDGPDLQGGAPLVLQDVKADSPYNPTTTVVRYLWQSFMLV